LPAIPDANADIYGNSCLLKEELSAVLDTNADI
jgi:hypothetical protein